MRLIRALLNGWIPSDSRTNNLEFIIVISLCALLSPAWNYPLNAQAYTCPENPTWNAISCSMHRAIQPGDGGSFHLTFVLERSDYRDYIVVKGASTVRLRIYHHFKNPDVVAGWLADAWAAQPPKLQRSSMPFMLSIDFAGPVYWDYTDTPEARHISEFPASYVHEDAGTLDWAYEELITHEMCHVIDKKAEVAGSRFSDSRQWLAAVAADGDYVTQYARENRREDFAESCAAYLLDGLGKRLTDAHRSHLREKMPNRTAYLEGLFSSVDDLVAFPGDMSIAISGSQCPQ